MAETFRAAIESYPTFDSTRGSEKAWLFGIATNLLRRHWRTERRRLLALERSASMSAEHIDPLLGMADGVANRIDAETDAARLLIAVVDLPVGDRDLLFLSGWERLTSTEIGQALEIAPASVRSRLHRIRRDLRKSIDSPLSHPNRPEEQHHPRQRAAAAPPVRPCRRGCDCCDRSGWVRDSPGHPQY